MKIHLRRKLKKRLSVAQRQQIAKDAECSLSTVNSVLYGLRENDLVIELALKTAEQLDQKEISLNQRAKKL